VGALSGICIVDLSRVLAAPFATQLLGDLGADVIKIERPTVGDDSRQYGPPNLSADPDADSGFYLSCNRNKRSVTLDYSKPEGARILRELVAKSDVMIENFRTGVLAKYALDYAALAPANPRLVYCSVTGYGQSGPYANRPGYDGVFQAMSGMMSVSGHPDGAPGGGPMKVGVSMVDIVTGLYAANAIQAALRHRDATGEGQYIDMALLDCGLAALSHYAQNYLISGVVPGRRGNGGFGGIPSQTFRCADADIFVVASTNKQFAAFADVLERPDLASDPRFANVSDRITHRNELLEVLTSVFVKRTAADWLAALDAADVPASPINDVPGALANPQIKHREMLGEVRRGDELPIPILNNPIRLSATPIDQYRAPPMLGEDTDAVLGELLRYDQARIAGLREAGVL